MKRLLRAIACHPALALGGALPWGVVELVALQRAPFTARRPPKASARQ